MPLTFKKCSNNLKSNKKGNNFSKKCENYCLLNKSFFIRLESKWWQSPGLLTNRKSFFIRLESKWWRSQAYLTNRKSFFIRLQNIYLMLRYPSLSNQYLTPSIQRYWLHGYHPVQSLYHQPLVPSIQCPPEYFSSQDPSFRNQYPFRYSP